MAGITLPNTSVELTTGAASTLIAPPVGKFESVSLMAALGAGQVADGYIDVFLTVGATPTRIIFNEPVRYRQPGGNIILLLNFIVNGGQLLQVVSAIAPFNMVATAFNRFQFDA